MGDSPINERGLSLQNGSPLFYIETKMILILYMSP